MVGLLGVGRYQRKRSTRPLKVILFYPYLTSWPALPTKRSKHANIKARRRASLSRDNEISFLIRQFFVRMTVVPTPIGFSNVRYCCVRFCVFHLKRCN